MSRLRPALRLGRRMAFASVGRAALVLALIAVPTTGFAALAVVFQSTQPTTEERLDHDLGHAAAQLQAWGPDVPGLHQDPVDWTATETEPGSPADGAAATTAWADPLDHVPAGARSIPVATAEAVLEGAHGPLGLSATEGAVWSPVLDGRWRVLDGRAPERADELMLTPAALDRMGLHVGDHIALTDPVRSTFTITGTLRDLGSDPDALGVFVPWGTFSERTADAAGSDTWNVTVYLPDDAPTWSEIRALNAHGILVESRPVVLDPPDDRLANAGQASIIGWYVGALGLVAVFALFEVALLAGAAFLVGTRADARSYAIVTSVGGDRGFVRSVVAGSGLVLGVTGAVLGLGAGIGLGALAFHLIDDGDVTKYPGLHLPVGLLTAVAAFGVVAGLVSSLVAARAATRVNVLAALRGSLRPAPTNRPARRRRRTWGPVLIVAGALLTLGCGVGVLALNDRPVQGEPDHWALVVGAGVALGPCLVQLGVALCSPEVLTLAARIASRMGLAARLAGRDARRNPVRTIPVLASVMSVVFVASVLVTYTASSHARFVQEYEYRTAVGVATSDVSVWDETGEHGATHDAAVTRRAASIAATVFGHDRIRVLGSVSQDLGSEPGTLVRPRDQVARACPTPNTTTCASFLGASDNSSPHIVTGTVDDYAVLTGHRPSAAVRDALHSGRAVSLWPEYARDGSVHVDTFRGVSSDTAVPVDARPSISVAIPAVLDVQTPRIAIGVFMTRATAQRYGVPAVDGLLVTRLPADISAEQYGELATAWQSNAGADRDRAALSFQYEAGPVDGNAAVKSIALALAAAVTIGATAVAIGLARSDGRRDDEVLDAIGAAPRLRRRVSAWQAAILTSVGSVVGALLGLLPIRALTLRFGPTPAGVTHMPFVPDWPTLALLAIGLPLLVTVGTWATAGRSRRVAVRRAH